MQKVNSYQGEGGVCGVIDSSGFQRQCVDGYCKSKLGTLGLMRATDVPELKVKLVQGPGKISLAFGAKGCGELCMILTGAACSHAYY